MLSFHWRSFASKSAGTKLLPTPPLFSLAVKEKKWGFAYVSFSCRGLNAIKACYIKSLLIKTAVLLLREHSAERMQALSSIDDNFLFKGYLAFVAQRF
jgi:hypothetical protein